MHVFSLQELTRIQDGLQVEGTMVMNMMRCDYWSKVNKRLHYAVEMQSLLMAPGIHKKGLAFLNYQ